MLFHDISELLLIWRCLKLLTSRKTDAPERNIVFIQRLKYPSWRSTYSIKSKLLTGEALWNLAPTNPPACYPVHTVQSLGPRDSCHVLVCQVLASPCIFAQALPSCGPHSLPADNPPSLKAFREIKCHFPHYISSDGLDRCESSLCFGFRKLVFKSWLPTLNTGQII